MGAEGTLGGMAVHFLRAGPAFWRAQDDGRPAWLLGEAVLPGFLLDCDDAIVAPVERRGDILVDVRRVVALHEERFVAVALEEGPDIFVALAAEHRGTADLVAVEVQNRQHGAVADGIQEAGTPPGAGQ